MPTNLGVVRSATDADYPAVITLLAAAGLPTAGVPRTLVDFLQGSGIGAALVRALLDRARDGGLREVYLLTPTAERWFPRFGFAPVERAEVPPAVRGSVEFREACPASAVVMRLALRD